MKNILKNILLTNDDGIHAEGLQLILNAIRGEYNITVVAPDVEKSSSGLSISTLSSIQVKRVDLGTDVLAFSVGGTPTDCVKLALSGGFCDKPDLIISGINPGSNAGRNLFYSGTVGAVIEGSFKGFAGVAFSMGRQPGIHPELAFAVPLVREIISYLLTHPLPDGTLLNVNFPSSAPYKGLKWTKQGVGVWKELPHTTCDISSGSASYFLGMEHYLPPEEESDTYWLERGFVTLVPLRTELTDLKILEDRREMIFNLSKKWVNNIESEPSFIL